MKYGLYGLLAIFLFLLVWGLVEPYVIEVVEERAEIYDLPRAWEGQRVALLSDLQIGMWMDNIPTVRRSVARLIKIRPALVMIAGDFVYGHSEETHKDLKKVIASIRPLPEAGIPTYAVFGNHDYRMDRPEVPPNLESSTNIRKALEEIGIQVLQNQAVPLPAPPGASSETDLVGDEALYLVGVDARWPGLDHPQDALAHVPASSPRLVMMHNPNSFPFFPRNTAPMAVAGHNHGGQIRIPFMPTLSYMRIVKREEVHGDGWIKDFGAPGNHLYVNRGIGFSVIPIRINCRPEITIFTLSRSVLKKASTVQ